GAARRLEVSAADLDWRHGAAWVRGVAGRSLSLAQLAQASRPGAEHRAKEIEPRLEARRYYGSDQPPFAYGVHAVVVDVDPETGAARVERYIVVSDSGVLINPTIAEGQ